MADEEQVANDGGEAAPDTAAIETRAREMGWIPKEEFRGDPEKFIPADQFVARGEELLPIIKADRRKLQSEVQTTRQQLEQTQRMLSAAQESIEELKTFNSKMSKDQAKSRRSELAAELKAARESGDVEKELEIQDELSELSATIREKSQEKRTTTVTTGNEASHPEFKAWASENPWFGQDKRRTSLAMGIAEELKETGLKGRELLDRVSEEVEKTFGGNPRRQSASRVEGARGGSPPNGDNGTPGKTYADLPADAKTTCERQAKRLVGEGRAFKTIQDWRNHYVRTYFA